jgi:dihydroorotate dehydrogenase (NAD+) catalytic subunit
LNKKIDTKINIAGIEFKNPIMTASGTFGSGMEYADFVDLNELGAVITKGVSAIPWEGNPTPRVAETPSGMLNAIGLQNPGVEVFINRDLEFLKQFDVRIIVNVCGKTIEDYLKVVRALAGTGADMLEINISCPNVKAGALSFGQEPKVVEEITKKIKKEAKQPVIMKLTPNVTDIREIAKAAEAGGADAISLINTITGMKIDIWKRKFALANKTGGLSGPAIHPVAVRMVYDCARTVKIPIIGMGGVESGEDAIELMLAGATAVAVGTSNFYRPDNAIRVLDEMAEVMEKQEVSDIKEFINGVS